MDVDTNEIELAMSIAEQAANDIIEEWQRNMDDVDFIDNPGNIAVYNLARNTISVITQYRAERLSDAEMMGEVDR